MKQLEVQIMGQNYLLGCPEGGEEQLLDAVGRVNSAMCKIRDAGKIKARDRIAVLAALNLAFALGEHSAQAGASAEPVHSAHESIDAGEDVPELSELLRRLDRALGIDGQLL